MGMFLEEVRVDLSLQEQITDDRGSAISLHPMILGRSHLRLVLLNTEEAAPIFMSTCRWIVLWRDCRT